MQVEQARQVLRESEDRLADAQLHVILPLAAMRERNNVSALARALIQGGHKHSGGQHGEPGAADG
jgi:hypothetical protein